ncbi:hypothetical protein H1R20_g15063, partial [Candolleomyces eurysporus]
MPLPTPHEPSDRLSPDNPFNPPLRLAHGQNLLNTPPSRVQAPFNELLARSPILDRVAKSTLEHNSQSFADKQTKSTPIARRAFKQDPKRDDHKEDVGTNVGPIIGLKDNGAWACSLYLHLVDDSRIDDFLEFLEKKKNTLTVPTLLDYYPQEPHRREDSLQSYIKLFNLILACFVLKLKNIEKLKHLDELRNFEFALREAINTHQTNLPHKDQYPTTLVSRPDVSVRADGPSFQAPESKQGKDALIVGFSNMSSFKEMKLEKQLAGSVKDQNLQVSVYVRYVDSRYHLHQFANG